MAFIRALQVIVVPTRRMPLIVSAGESIHSLRPVAVNDPRHPCIIRSPNFIGELTIFINPNPPCYSGQEKRFSIQIAGQFLPDPGQPAWSFDDVVVGVELERPVLWSNVPFPNWITKSILKWLRSSNPDISLQFLFEDDSGIDDGSGGCEMGQFLCHPSQSSLIRPFISQSLICSASKFNAQLSPNDHRQKWEVMPSMHRRHDFERELVEDSSFLFQPGMYAPPTPQDRRDYFRSFDQNMVSPRHIHQYNPNVVYMFELSTDFFDFNSFDLRPKIRRRSSGQLENGNNFSRPPAAASLFFSGKWSMNMKTATQVAPNHSRVVVACKNRMNDHWFFCIVFDYYD